MIRKLNYSDEIAMFVGHDREVVQVTMDAILFYFAKTVFASPQYRIIPKQTIDMHVAAIIREALVESYPFLAPLLKIEFEREQPDDFVCAINVGLNDNLTYLQDNQRGAYQWH